MRNEGHESCERKSLDQNRHRTYRHTIPAKKTEENHEMSPTG
jgi:hypothetical protein